MESTRGAEGANDPLCQTKGLSDRNPLVTIAASDVRRERAHAISHASFRAKRRRHFCKATKEKKREKERAQLIVSVRQVVSKLATARTDAPSSSSLPLVLFLFRAPPSPGSPHPLVAAGVALVAAVPRLSVAPRARFAAG